MGLSESKAGDYGNPDRNGNGNVAVTEVQKAYTYESTTDNSGNLDSNGNITTIDQNAGNPETESTCSICLYETDRVNEEAKMPCCGVDTSSVWYCKECIKLLCQSYPGGIATCPTCRSNKISIEGEKVVAAVHKEKCRMCCQTRVIVSQRLCSACLVGSKNPLRYECDRCHRTQTIPHPMWRYQETPEKFGGATWACHQRCGDYTHWRVIQSDVNRVPIDDAPDSWGLGEQLLSSIRAQRASQRGL